MAEVRFKTQYDLEYERLLNFRRNAVITKYQLKVMIKRRNGLLGRIRALMRSLPEDDETRMAWEEANEFKRDSRFIMALARHFELDDTEVDRLFEQASEIEV